MRRRSILPLLAFAALPLAASGCGSSSSAHAPSSNGPVRAVLGDYRITTNTADPKTDHVTFAVKNEGKAAHELVVLRTNRTAGSLGHGKRVPENGNVGETGDLRPGQSKKLTLTLKPGHYALICNLPGHYAAGMHADFTIR